MALLEYSRRLITPDSNRVKSERIGSACSASSLESRAVIGAV